MDQAGVVLKLLELDASKRKQIITKAVDQYFIILYKIASDIYDSCIEDFYIQYTPESYTRHGDIEGFNLYNANEIELNDNGIRLFADANQLLPYAGKTDRRQKVLDAVMNGIRGTKLKYVAGWPLKWSTTYPNRFSQYKLWSSSATTMHEIYMDFVENVSSDTQDIFWDLVSRLL